MASAESQVRAAWAAVADEVKALALNLRLHVEERVSIEPGGTAKEPASMNEAVRELSFLVSSTAKAVADSVHDPGSADRVSGFAAALEQALAVTVRALPPDDTGRNTPKKIETPGAATASKTGREPARSARPPLAQAKRAAEQDVFLHVLATGEHGQLVAMTLAPGQDSGEDSYPGDQFLVLLDGEGEITLGGASHPYEGRATVHVPAHLRRNVRNTGNGPMRLVVMFAPAQYPPGTVYHTKADAARAARR